MMHLNKELKWRWQFPFSLLVLLTILAGCATGPGTGPGKLTPSELLDLAKTSEAKGHFVVAAQNYLQLAQISSSPAKEEHQLSAATILVRSQYVDKAKDVVAKINLKRLNKPQLQRYNFIHARIALAEQKPEEALKYLRTPPAEKNPEWHRLRADAYGMSNNHLESVRERVLLQPLLTDTTAIERNQQQIWQTLNELSGAALLTLRKQPPPDALSGWLELAYYVKASIKNPEQFETQISKWRTNYPDHPAQGAFIENLLLHQEALIKRPENIALLLPLTGSFSGPATAVRDGFLAAFYARPSGNYNPTIRVYDTTDNVKEGVTAYKKAIDDGADFIVGPLHKPLMEKLADNEGFPVTTLALNYLSAEDVIVKNLFQYGLLPEDEARQVAERAWIDGHSKALALIPEGEWGNRMLATFLKHWQQLNGTIIEVQRYNPNQHDFSGPVLDLLNIHHSKQRHKNLEATLGENIKFEPRRRQDIDFIYVAAFPRQARQIRPQLKFYYAANIPIYSTSHAFTGESNRNKDRDMDGIVFCDMPWVFTGGKGQKPNWREITRIWKSSATPYKRLYAMGIDAYQLVSRLEYLQQNPQEHINALSGTLFLDEKQRIHRQLLWARFQKGRPVLMDALPPITKNPAS